MIYFLGGQRWAEHQGVRHSAGETQHLRPGHQLPDSASWWGAAASGSVSSSQPRHDGLLCGWVWGSLLKSGQSCSGKHPIKLSGDNGRYKWFMFVFSETLCFVSIYESLGTCHHIQQCSKNDNTLKRSLNCCPLEAKLITLVCLLKRAEITF